MTKNNKIPLLSFFTGAGFLDIGFLQNDFDIIWHNEYHPAFVEAFETGLTSLGYNRHSNRIQNTESIVDIGPNQIAKEAFANAQRPEIFGIIGGPPCPDFSIGGKNKGHHGDNGRLSEVYTNRIIELSPTFFLFENVPGLLKTEKHRLFLSKLLKKLQGRFTLDLSILNSLDFGVPQDRERIFLIGFDKRWLRKRYQSVKYKQIDEMSSYICNIDKNWSRNFLDTLPHWFTWPENPKFRNAKNRFPWPNSPVPANQKPSKPDCPAELMVGTYICDDTRFSLPNSSEGFNPKSNKFHSTLEGDVSKKSFKRLHRYKYSPTAAYGNNEVHLHPTLPRRITVREALMIQSVPNQYILPSSLSLTDKFKTIGNGVPVKLANSIAESVAAHLLG